MEPIIPGIFFFLMFLIGTVIFVIGIFKKEKDASNSFIIFGIIMAVVGILMLANVPVVGPYFEDPKQEKIYLVEGTMKLNEKYATGLAEWSLSDGILKKKEILYGSKDEPVFKAGDCVSLQNNELKTIKIQGCGNNS